MGPANTGGIFKEVHHDIWAYDARSPVALFDTQINGQARKALYEAGNTGWRYLLTAPTVNCSSVSTNGRWHKTRGRDGTSSARAGLCCKRQRRSRDGRRAIVAGAVTVHHGSRTFAMRHR